MKKLIAAVLTAFLMSLGLVATTTSTASAADCDYPQTCVDTTTDASGLKTKTKNTARIRIRPSSAGNGKPAGKVTVFFVNNKGNVKSFTRNLSSGTNGVFTFRGLTGGRHTVIVTFTPAKDSPYLASSDTTKVQVKANKGKKGKGKKGKGKRG